MECVDPFRKGLISHRCGKCEACRRYRRRVLATRLFLEAGLHDASSFVTLTYAEDPKSIAKRDVQLWLKRFRAVVSPRRVRFLAVGEYGEMYGRPHYHALVFGLDALSCQEAVNRSWRLGFTQVAPFTLPRAMYVAQYTLKGYSEADYECQFRERPFCLRSLRPGLGYGCADVLASFYKTRVGQEEFCSQGDVSAGIRIDGAIWPLGDYLRSKVRALAGLEVAREHFRAVRQLEQQSVVSSSSVDLLQEYLSECARRREVVRARLNVQRSNTRASL